MVSSRSHLSWVLDCYGIMGFRVLFPKNRCSIILSAYVSGVLRCLSAFRWSATRIGTGDLEMVVLELKLKSSEVKSEGVQV
jgi:hypothetical protein